MQQKSIEDYQNFKRGKTCAVTTVCALFISI